MRKTGKKAQKRAPKSTEQRSHESDLRAARRNPLTRLIVAQKAELRQRISSDPRLTKDFKFLLNKTGWNPATLLDFLYWDSNTMHVDAWTVIRRAKPQTWPIDLKTLEATVKIIDRAAAQIERVNNTQFSPARSAILRNSQGLRPPPRQEEYLLQTFGCLPNVLRFYGGELKRKITGTRNFWQRHCECWKYLVELTRRGSVYENIRLATPDNKYNSSRLLRLVNTSRGVQSLPPIEHRAFIVWLNRLRKRSSTPLAERSFHRVQVLRATAGTENHQVQEGSPAHSDGVTPVN
jgi:hypothetical protein